MGGEDWESKSTLYRETDAMKRAHSQPRRCMSDFRFGIPADGIDGVKRLGEGRVVTGSFTRHGDAWKNKKTKRKRKQRQSGPERASSAD